MLFLKQMPRRTAFLIAIEALLTGLILGVTVMVNNG